MKLIGKINQNFISIAFSILFVGSIVFYIMLRTLTINQIDSRLIESKQLIESQFANFLKQPQHYVWNEELISVSVIENEAKKYMLLSDTLLNINSPKDLSSFRKLEFQHKHRGQNFRIKIFTNLEFSDQLVLKVMLLMVAIGFFFLLSYYIVFSLVANNSLFDFYDTIKKLKGFKIEQPQEVDFSESDIDEFDELNSTLSTMTTKIRKDYNNLKEFTENASHEIQTPLAIIQNKIELLIQDENLNEQQLKAFADIMDSTSRLSKLNRGLSHLVKIESGQYVEKEHVDLKPIIKENLETLEEVLASKNIKTNTICEHANKVLINPNLAELLIFNILKNAFKHNINGGFVNIELKNNLLTVANSAKDTAMDLENLSKRFSKGNDSKSLGLGLAIITKICKNYNINLDYKFEENMHIFAFEFNE